MCQRLGHITGIGLLAVCAFIIFFFLGKDLEAFLSVLVVR
jgi:hypothetical protein